MEALGVQLLWSDEWYDGPVAGLARYNGKDYWYSVDPSQPWAARFEDRPFLLFELTAVELAECLAEHAAYEEISTRLCWHLSRDERRLKDPRREIQQEHFTDRWGKDLYQQPTDREPVGQFSNPDW